MEILDKKISKIHNYIYANEGLSNSETLNEFLKLFYCKILDEQNENKLAILNSDTDIISHVNILFSELKEKLRGLIDNEEAINLKKETILFVFSELKNIKLNSINPDTKGHILQKIIDRSYRESRGQFFTPAPVVDFIVQMIRPQKRELGCDPASGTGGFMFSALEYIVKNEKVKNNDLLKNIYFYDISKSLIKLISMRMMFEFSDCEANCTVKDSIVEDFDMTYDYVLTNPPFGTQGKIIDPNILKKYTLGIDENGKVVKSQVPDLLFVEKIIRILKIHGRSAIVLPDGDFENPSQEYFRKYLINNVRVDAIVSLPDGTFIPYGTGVKSSIIFFTKVEKDELQKLVNSNYQIFYGKITKLGYTFSKHSKDVLLDDGNYDEDYTNIINSYFSNSYNNNAYLVNVQTIINNKYIMSESFHSPEYNNVITSISKQKCLPLKDLVTFKYSKEKINKEKLYNYVEIADINSYTSEIINSTEIIGEELPSRASYILNEGDLIVATSGNSIGTEKQSKALVTKSYNGCLCTNGLSVMKAKNISPYFLLKFFNSDIFLKQMLKYKYGTAIPCVGREDFENILVPIPSDEEIKNIENKIKRAIELREEALNLMKN